MLGARKLGAKTGNQLVGYIIAGINGNESGKIYWLYVAPEGRGNNIGKILLEQSIERMKQHGMRRVSLVTHNFGDYYAKLGFQIEKREKLYGVGMNVMSYQWPNQ